MKKLSLLILVCIILMSACQAPVNDLTTVESDTVEAHTHEETVGADYEASRSSVIPSGLRPPCRVCSKEMYPGQKLQRLSNIYKAVSSSCRQCTRTQNHYQVYSQTVTLFTCTWCTYKGTFIVKNYEYCKN